MLRRRPPHVRDRAQGEVLERAAALAKPPRLITGAAIWYNAHINAYERKNEMKKYVCKVCGYVYDPANNNNVAFEDLPDDWTCPMCGVGKDQFEEM